MRFRVDDEQFGIATLYPECIDNNDTIRVASMSCARFVRGWAVEEVGEATDARANSDE
jgi:hypothetical protein